MKVSFILIVTAVFAILLAGCKNDKSPVEEAVLQTSLFWAASEVYLTDTTTSVDGWITGDPLPSLYHVRVNGQIFDGSGYSEMMNGYVSFAGTPLDYTPDPVNVEVSTSSGILNGSCSYPGIAGNISLSSSSLQVGDPLIISWTTGADFVQLYAYCEWNDQLSQYHYLSLDTLVAGNSVTYNFPFISQGGRVMVGSIRTLCGPYPAPGAVPNMSGDGIGFLYYKGYYQDLNQEVVIGTGFPAPPNAGLAPPPLDERNAALEKAMAVKLGW